MATLSLLGYQLCIHEFLQVERERGIGYFRCAEQLLGGRTRRSRRNEMAKESKAPRLSKRSKSSCCSIDIHISIIFEMIFRIREFSSARW